ncbi:MAG TPA: threonine/serine dehydratase [Longimicrobiales bacterium]|nr:threonine/serine dehydratase [Longimicrobiales bacterium]
MFTDLRPVDVFRAAQRIRGIAVRTPLRHSAALSERLGRDVHLKLETEQVTGSFKLRGAVNTLAALPERVRRRGVVASSAGNHGLGVAYAARHFGAPATLFVPRTAPQVKKDGIAALGARVDDSAPDYDAAMVLAKAFAAEHDVPFINPCLGDPLLAGQGTVALEILEELPGAAAVVMPVGGGGLLGGAGCFLRPVAPNVRILGAQSEETAAMSRSLAAGRLVEIPSVPTLADGLAGQIDDEALAIGRYALDDIVTLSEAEIGATIAWLWQREHVTAEGAGAVAAGALLHDRLRHLPDGPVVAVVSGRNIDRGRLDELLDGASAASVVRPR